MTAGTDPVGSAVVPAGPAAASGVDAAVLSWASAPGARRVLAAARDKLERGHRGDRVTVASDLTAADRRDVGRLLSKAWEVSGKPVTLGQLRRAIAPHLSAPHVAVPNPSAPGRDASSAADGGTDRAVGDPLVCLLTATGGPLRDLPAERAEAARVEQQRRSDAASLLLDAGVPTEVVRAAVCGRWLGKVDDELCDKARRVAAVWHALPAHPAPAEPVGGDQRSESSARSPGGRARLLSELASVTLTSPHDLDRDTDIGRLVARILAATARAATGQDPAGTGPVTTADAWRQAWASVNVLCDRVSSTVLVLNVPLTGSGPGAVLATAAADVGEPCWLTARSLDASFAASASLHTVRVCENPAVVEAAADELGASCPPLVCVYGRPSAAAWTLLRQLAGDGVRMLVSTDRDAVGAQIAADLLALPGAQEWCPAADGEYEEDRLEALLTDLRDATT